MDNLRTALVCVQGKKWFIFPGLAGTKQPDLELVKHWSTESSNDPVRITEWWTKKPDAPICIDLGRSNLAVLDFDNGPVPAELGLPVSLEVTTSRGTHYYVTGTSKQSKMFINDTAVGDLKSAGGYVLGPNSTHPSGAIYKANNKPLVDITSIANVVASITKAPEHTIPLGVNGSTIPRGQHDIYLNRLSGKLRHIGLEEEAIYDALIEVCEKRCEDLGDDYLEMARKHAHNICKKPIGNDGTVFSSAASHTEVPTDWNTCFKAVKELEAGDVRMMINNFLPEGTTFVGALPGEGKTFLGLSIAKALTRQEDFLGNYNFEVPEKIPVIYMIPESGARAFRKRCEKFNIPNDRKLFLCRTISEGSTLRLSDPLLIEAVKEMKPVVILDTLVRFSESDDENAAMQNRQLANDITVLRQMGAVAVVGLHHATKGMREKGMSLETVLRGSGDIAAYADAVYGMLRDNNLFDRGNGPNEIDIACVKPRDFDPPLPFRIAASQRTNDKTIGQAPGIRSLIDLDGDFRIVQMADVQAKRDAELVRLITEDPAITLPELEKATGQSTWVIRKSFKGLGWTKQKGGSKGGHVWIKKADLINLDSPVKSEN